MVGKSTGGRRWWPAVLGAGTVAALLAFAWACNDHRLVPFKGLVKINQCDKVVIPEKPKLDLLWVVDNSASMCQEQANLARNFGAMANKLQGLDADINVAVVTTDVEDVSHQGRFQNTPATANHLSCDQACLEDAHCGGGCLCGVPHVHRCAADSDCDGGQSCVAASGSSIKHCAASCVNPGLAHEPTSDKCGAEVREQQVHALAVVGIILGVESVTTICTGYLAVSLAHYVFGVHHSIANACLHFSAALCR